MPATESTWRNMTLMHRIFAVSGVVLTLATIWMFYKDHARSWKKYQYVNVQTDVQMTKWREAQFQTDVAEAEVARLATAESIAKALPIDPAKVAAFRDELTKQEKSLPDQAAELDALQKASAEAAAARAKALEARAAADAKLDDAELRKAALEAEKLATEKEAAAATIRARIVATLQGYVDQAKIDETKKLGERKFKSADLDKAKADLDIGVRDGLPKEEMNRRQGIIDAQKKKYDELNADYQELSAHRKSLEDTLAEITAPVAAASKELSDAQAAQQRLKTAVKDKREGYIATYDYFPWYGPGKSLLNGPIIDAFMGRRKPENLWSEGLEQDYVFKKVRRFDRCTTCHGSMQKSQPGEPTVPLYAPEQSFLVTITPRTEDELKANRQALKQPEVDANGQPIPYTLMEYLGLELADHGLLNLDDVIVKYVQPKSPSAAAKPLESGGVQDFPTAEQIQQQIASGITPEPSEVPDRLGLVVGDVLEAIEGSDLVGQYSGPVRAAASLLDLAKAGKPFQVRIRRGLPHPYNTHPRLDLFLSDSSPHKLSTFACTICHEGQGSATDFKWASHTPNDPTTAREWSNDYGWFNNHHWIYPMLPERFTQATCLKCHHDVVELEPSDRFPEPPAAKLMHGYHLIRKYGCYGCHEVNGYDGPTKRVGPDLRLEPNFFAVAQQLQWEAGKRKGELAGIKAEGEENEQAVAAAQSRLAKMLDLAAQLAAHPEEDGVRRQLMGLIEEDKGYAAPAGSPSYGMALAPDTHRLAGMLRDVDAPGSLRKPGPSLRFVKQKTDPAFLYDWIYDPTHFRPSTRMPKFFKLLDHLEAEPDSHKLAEHLEAEPDSHKLAEQLEPIEVRGLVSYLLDRSQNFEPVKRPEGVDEWTDEEMIARGKLQFETRGCLACHTHNDFPDTKKFRTKEEIVQGPDLSNIGAKFSRAVNEKGPEWLYSWIKEPTRYHARTVMPNLFLEPLKQVDVVTDANGDPIKDENGMDKTRTRVFDPAEDITTYLLADAHGDWKPVRTQQELAAPLVGDEKEALKTLTLEYLNEAFFAEAADRYFVTGLPESMRSELKGAETELITADGKLSDAQRLRYIGLKTVGKYGCYGCHDIPGFEDAKPIGTQLQNWGRKDPSRLAFEHITHYTGGHGHAAHGDDASHAKDDHAKDEHAAEHAGDDEESLPVGFKEYYDEQLSQGSRIGFAYQKLKEPRSYDYEKTANKRYNERLRMPQFPFTAEDREAVVTFVLGLVAEPPREKYLYRPNPRQKAVIEGKVVLEKFNCGGCHILEADKYKISYLPEQFGEQVRPGPVYPFLQAHFSPAQLKQEATPDASNRLHSQLAGISALTKNQGLPELVDFEDSELIPEDRYDPETVKRSIELVAPAIVDGHAYLPGQAKMSLSGSVITSSYTGHGGMLTRYLLPRVTSIEQQSNPNASGAEAYGWLPPPLFGEGDKVQSNWLYEFLLEPYTIRPAVFLRMPKFNLSRDEATKLVNYFAAVDNANYPYETTELRQDSHLAAMQAAYAQQTGGQRNRLDDALKIVVDKNFCVKCHIVGDYDPGGSLRAKAPNLADIHRRMRPEYLKQWIGNPKMILPYTAMPVNIPYEPGAPQGKAPADLFVGDSEQQVQGLVDLLMNFDHFSKGKNQIAPLVPATPPMTPEATPAANTAAGG